MKKKKDKKNRIIQKTLRPLYRWHRRIGMITVLFVIILAITGIMLNHNAQLGLNKSFITNSWLLELYNIQSNSHSEFGYPKDNLTMDRVVLDIHTGRFFGKLGPFFMDAIAFLLLILSTTGVYMWLKRLVKKNKKN